MKKIEKKIKLGERTLTLSTGELAPQANGAVLAQLGETVVMATVVSSPLKQELDYFPLSVDYQERLYAGGRIKGSRWVKREGKPTDEEILSGRLIDRSIRPLFPKGYKKDVQVIVMVLSVDLENDPSTLGAIATSAAIHISGLPWKGPVSILRIGKKGKDYLTNPVDKDMQESDLDLVVSNTSDAVIMIEAGTKEVTEEEIIGGIEHAEKDSKAIIKLIEDLAKEVGVKREVFKKEEPPPDLVKRVKKLTEDKIENIVRMRLATEGGKTDEVSEFYKAVSDAVSEDEASFVPGIIDKQEKEFIREMILKKKKRLDGRKLTEIRPLSARISVLPRVHGSAIFKRGLTQAMSVATLGAQSLGQLLETAEGEEEKRYMHHYSMPPYSTGETGRIGSPGRREIGHGALAERALLPVIPSEEEFPYAIRVVSEITSSNGSTSMASVCGSTLSLMDAGVPIKAPVSGIAMGLIIEDKNVAILTDIMGIEDFNGDMDFKVAGTEKGITALQLDVKTLNLSVSILKDALAQAKIGRMEILKVITDTISEPRKEVSQHAPKIKVVMIPTDKIGEIIGPGGKVIKKMMADTDTEIDVDDDGRVAVSGINEEKVDQAVETIKLMVKEPVAGEIYEGTVKRLQPFGAFVEILPGKDGMVHVSDISEDFVKDPADVLSIDQKVQVRVKEIDSMGRVNLSMVMDPSFDQKKEERRKENSGRRENNFRRNDSRNRNPRGRRFDSRKSGEKSGGPHFPASRLTQDQKKRY